MVRPSARSRAISGASLLGVLLAGCRGCDRANETADPPPAASATGPRMPVGLLEGRPPPAADGIGPGEGGPPLRERLRLVALPRVEWVELRIVRGAGPRTRSPDGGPDSRYLSLDALALVHDALARASPGFDLFQPRVLDAAGIGRLRFELVLLRTDVAETADRKAALVRWGEVSALLRELRDDPSWLETRAAWVGLLDALVAWCDEATRSSGELLVAGM